MTGEKLKEIRTIISEAILEIRTIISGTIGEVHSKLPQETQDQLSTTQDRLSEIITAAQEIIQPIKVEVVRVLEDPTIGDKIETFINNII